MNICSQYPVICANRLIPSLIRSAAAAKNLNSVTIRKARRTMPHRRGTYLSLEIWILCSTPLLVWIPRTPRILTNLVKGLLTSHTFSSSLQSRRRRSEYANYVRKSWITCQQASDNSILVTYMAMRRFQMGYRIICTRLAWENQTVVITSSSAIQPSMTRPFRRKIGPTASQLKSLVLRLLSVIYANMHFLSLL
jgi:hypothetical protein